MLGSHLRLAGALLVLAGPATAAWTESQVTETVDASTGAVVTIDAFDVLHVLWEEGGTVYHQDGPAPEVVGAGGDLDQATCLMCNEVYVVWVDAGQVMFRSWKSDLWHDAEVVGSAGLGEPRGPRVAKAGGPRVTWAEVDEGEGTFHVLYSELSGGSFTAPLTLAGPLPLPADGAVGLDVTEISDDDDVLVAWNDGAASPAGTWGRVLQGTTWNPATLLLEGAGGTLSLGIDDRNWITYLASHVPDTGCDCNTVLVAEGPGAAFGVPVDIGTGHIAGDAERPRDVAVHLTVPGDPVVVWRHKTTTGGVLSDERLVVARRTEGVWGFDDTPAPNRDARDPALTSTFVGNVTVAWCDDTDASWNVYVASESDAVGVENGAAIAPVALGAAWPNPTTGSVRVRLAPGLVTDATATPVRIVDVAGRTIRSLVTDRSGELRWDGRDAAGREVPAGVYVMIAGAGADAPSRRIVVTR